MASAGVAMQSFCGLARIRIAVSGQCCHGGFRGVLRLDARARVTTDPCSDDLGGVIVAVFAAGGNYSVALTQRPGEPRIRQHWRCRGWGFAARPESVSAAAHLPARPRWSAGSCAAGRRFGAEAARETERLPDDLLLGAILADRYLRGPRRRRRSSRRWLTRFGDQAEAPAIRGLLERLAPAGHAVGRRFAAGAPRPCAGGQPAGTVRAEPRRAAVAVAGRPQAEPEAHVDRRTGGGAA